MKTTIMYEWLDENESNGWISSNKKGSSRVMAHIHRDMKNSSMWDILKMSPNEDPCFPSFIRWKMGFKNEIDIILTLATKLDSETEFFRSFLQDDTQKLMENFIERTSEKLNLERNP